MTWRRTAIPARTVPARRAKVRTLSDPCTRPARFIIRRCGSVQSFFFVSSRMFAHSRADGRWRFSGLAFHERRPFRQPQFRPSSPGLPLLAGQPVSQGVDQIIVCESVVLPARCGLLTFARGAFRVGGRDQPKLRVEDSGSGHRSPWGDSHNPMLPAIPGVISSAP